MLIALGVACSDDSIPRATELSAPIEEPVPVSQSEPAKTQASVRAADQPTAQAEPTAEDEVRNRVLIMRMAEEVQVFPYPADGLHQPHRFGAAALLLADGWLDAEDGRVWLRLDMNGERVGWIRLADSPLTLEEARALPRLEAPQYPTAWVPSTELEPTEVNVLGWSEDGHYLAVCFVGSETVVWLARAAVSPGFVPESRPIYTGPVAGVWAPRTNAPAALAAQVNGWRAQVSAWPNGPRIPFRLFGGDFPLLGRSLNGQWIAVRLDGLDPPIGWVSADAVSLTMDVEQLPIFLSAGLEFIELDENGRAISSMLAEPPDSWEWRTEGDLLINTHIDGQSTAEVWNPWTGDLRPVASLRVGDVSPDGRYAAHIEWALSSESAGGDVALVPLDGGDWVRFEDVSRPIPRDGGWPDTYWSPDSQWRLTVLFSYDAETPTRTFALGIDGRRVEVVGPRWVERWQDIVELGNDVIYLDEDGQEIEVPWSQDRLKGIALHWKPLPHLDNSWRGAKWSPDGRLVLATRIVESSEFTEQGLATLPGNLWPGWGYVEIGVFNADGQLMQVFRGHGWQCGSTRPRASWSPGGDWIAIGPGWVGCQ